MEQEEAKPKKYGSNNIYIDAAIDAIRQASEENKNMACILIVNDGENGGHLISGDVKKIASTLAAIACEDNIMAAILKVSDLLLSKHETGMPDEICRQAVTEILKKYIAH